MYGLHLVAYAKPTGTTAKSHEVAIDQRNGDVYLANLGVPSSVMKFQRGA